MRKDRIVYFEYLRVFAIAAVVMIHVAAQNIYDISAESLEWNVFNIYDSAVRWGVPVFLMISGAIFLSREIDTKKLYSKYIARLAISYCAWSVFYAIALPLCEYLVHKDMSALYASIIQALVYSTYHLWFLPMIIGLYMCVPFIRQIVQKKEISRYFLLLSFIFAFAVPLVFNLAKPFCSGLFGAGMTAASNVITDMKMDIVMGYAFYFVLGYELNNAELSKKQRRIIYIMGTLAFLLMIVLTALATRKAGSFSGEYYDYFSVLVALEAIAVHTWFKYRTYSSEKTTKAISFLAQHSFGAYLVHVFVLKVLQIMGLHTLSFSSVISVPIISLIVLIASFAIAFALDLLRKGMRKRLKNDQRARKTV